MSSSVKLSEIGDLSTHSKILIVDDDRVALTAASLALEAAGYQVVKRCEPIGTTAAVIRERPEVVLLDVNMPALEGDDVVRAIRRCESIQDVVVLLYSSKPVVELKQLAAACRADGYIAKSSDTERLAECVAHYLR
jgi:CheY-like chemotaxis protein